MKKRLAVIGPSAVLFSAGEGITVQRYTLRLAGTRGKMVSVKYNMR